MLVNSLYISVKDMNRAVEFYKKLFGKPPKNVTNRYSYFLVSDFYFGLYNPLADDSAVTYGNNCVVNFEVEDIDSEYLRVKEFAAEIDQVIEKQDLMSTFQFTDTEGNVLEIYSK